MTTSADQQLTVRHDLRPGDLGRVTALHGLLYAAEYGFDHTFEAYVAETLGEFGLAAPNGRDRLWIAQVEGRVVGSIGIVGREEHTAQLRWFLVDPEVRGRGLGRQLIAEALAFCRGTENGSVFLWTVHVLTAAARLYTAAGFRKTEAKPPAALWGKTLAEQRYDLSL